MGLSLTTIAFIILGLYLLSSIKILAEYERGVIFRLGRLLPNAKGPGIILVFAPIDRMVRISLRQEALEVPPQDIITRDNVTLKVNAVLNQIGGRTSVGAYVGYTPALFGMNFQAVSVGQKLAKAGFGDDPAREQRAALRCPLFASREQKAIPFCAFFRLLFRKSEGCRFFGMTNQYYFRCRRSAAAYKLL